MSEGVFWWPSVAQRNPINENLSSAHREGVKLWFTKLCKCCRWQELSEFCRKILISLSAAISPSEVLSLQQSFGMGHKVYKICVSPQHILCDQNQYLGWPKSTTRVLCFMLLQGSPSAGCIKHLGEDNGLQDVCHQLGELSQNPSGWIRCP